MRKGSAIGLVVGVVFMSIIVGIAAIPDEVLEESYIEKAKMPSVAAQDLIVATVPEAPETAEPEPIISEPEIPEISEPEPVIAEPEPPVSEPEPPAPAEPKNSENTENQADESKGNVIRVEVRDGVGTAQS
jgi:outer membrane biosynthesis protein TonB